MKKIFIVGFWSIIAFLLQSTLFQHLKFGGIAPNLLIIVVASYGFMRGSKSGIWTGFFCGVLSDIFFGKVLGVYAIIFMMIGFVNGYFRKAFFPDDIKLPMLLILSSDFAYSCLIYIILFLFRGRFHLGFYFLHVMIPELVYTIVMTCLLYPAILFMERKFNTEETVGVSEIE